MKLFSSKLVGNSFVLLVGNVAAQLVPLLVITILTRYLSPDIFGVFYLFVAITQTLSVVSGLRIEQTIMLPKSDDDGRQLFVFSLVVTIVLALFWELLVLISQWVLPMAMKEKMIYSWLKFAPLSVFLSGIAQSFFTYLNRLGKYESMSVYKIIFSLLNGAGQFLFAFVPKMVNGLIIGLITGQLLSGGLAIFKLRIDRLVRAFNLKRSIELIREYKDIPIFNTLITLTSTLSNQMPVMLFSTFYGNTATGYYGNGNRLLQSPINLITSSLGQVLFKELSDRKNERQAIFGLLKKTYLKLVILGLVPFTALFFFSPFVFKLALGEGGHITGTYMQVLIPWLYISFLNRPFYPLSIILNKQKQVLFINGVYLLVTLLSISVGFYVFTDIMVSLKLFGLSGILYSISILAYYFIIVKQHDQALDR